MAKHCRRCDMVKSDSDFAKNSNRKDGLQVYCRDCMNNRVPRREAAKRSYDKHIEKNRERSRNNYWQNRDAKITYMRQYSASNKQELATKASIRNRAYKLTALEAYGGAQCVCCNEKEPFFLTLDHVDNGRGNPADRSNGVGTTFFRWLRKSNYPQSLNLVVLCFNCNCGRNANNGVCPHELD